MTKTANINIRIEPEVKQEAKDLFGSFGISVTDAINIFLRTSIMEGAFLSISNIHVITLKHLRIYKKLVILFSGKRQKDPFPLLKTSWILLMRKNRANASPSNDLKVSQRSQTNQKTLYSKYKDHALTETYQDFRECHIQPDVPFD